MKDDPADEHPSAPGSLSPEKDKPPSQSDLRESEGKAAEDEVHVDADDDDDDEWDEELEDAGQEEEEEE